MKRWSVYSALVLSLLALYSVVQYPRGFPFTWDVFGYYLYLPATFIHEDPFIENREWLDEAMLQYNPSSTLYQVHEAKEGLLINKYSAGMAMVYAPGFFAGHIIAILTGAKTDGFSPPYVYSVLIWSFIVCVLGIWILRAVLSVFFEDAIAALALFLVVAGTNYFFTAYFNLNMPHGYLFTMYAAVIWLSMRFWDNGRSAVLVVLPPLVALMAIARPTEALAALIPIFWTGASRKAFNDKFRLLFLHRKRLIVGVSLAMSLVGVQLIYWKYGTGKWLYYSYKNPGEGMDFSSPHIADVLLSWRKGWLVYTPIMVFALAGIALMWRSRHRLTIPVLAFFIPSFYLVACWSTWWYADSFGQRALVQFYPVLALPLAVIAQRALQGNWLLRSAFLTLCGMFVALNLFQSWQISCGILPADRITKDYYDAVWLKTEYTPGIDSLLLVNRAYNNGFEWQFREHYASSPVWDISFEPGATPDSCPGLSTALTEYPWEKHFLLEEVSNSDHSWLECEIEVFPGSPESANGLIVTLCALHNGQPYGYHAWKLGDNTAAENRYALFMLTPTLRNNNDPLRIQLWNPGKNSACLSRLVLRSWNRKNPRP